MRWILPQAVFDGDALSHGVCVAISGDIVVGLEAPSRLGPDIAIEAVTGVLGPGLFDVQVNGGGGVMLNNVPTPGGVRKIAQAHRAAGTAFILPTVITDYPEVTERAAHAVLAEHGRNGVLGIHIEGPHISQAHKGTHDPARIRPFDSLTSALLALLRERGLPVLFTAAIETLEPGVIAGLRKMGVVVCAGHSEATAEQTERALAEGLSGFTHVFNAMPQMTSRAPGIVAAALNSGAYCGIIVDGHHIDDRMVRLAFNARPVGRRMVLVSDAMSTIGGPDSFQLYAETIRVQGGRLVNANGALAGAHIDLKTSVGRLIGHIGLSPADALAAATIAPRGLMEIPRQQLIGSRLEDLFLAPLAAAPTTEAIAEYPVRG